MRPRATEPVIRSTTPAERARCPSSRRRGDAPRQQGRAVGVHRLPPAHWKKVWSTNPLERLTKEIKRRTDVVGVLPNPAALLRLAGAGLVEADDKWEVSDRRYLPEGSMALLALKQEPTEAVRSRH